MKKMVFLFSLFLSLNLYSQKRPKVIYGDDGRVDVYDSKDPLFSKLSRSTVALLGPKNISRVTGTKFYELKGKSFKNKRRLCEEERFGEQPSFAFCSGFLVGPDLIVTAGHCMAGIEKCQETAFVFDYKMDSATEFKKKIPEDNVYFCDKVVSLYPDGKYDHALIKLRRKVKKRIPLLMRKEGEVRRGDPLIVIGHPSGLPVKIADGAAVRTSNNDFFVANLDTYGGNSGSAVFNTQTALIEGILVRGENDFVRDPRRSCHISNVCEDDDCRGEDITKISTITDFPKVVKYQKRFYSKNEKARNYAKKIYNLRKKKRPYYRDRN